MEQPIRETPVGRQEQPAQLVCCETTDLPTQFDNHPPFDSIALEQLRAGLQTILGALLDVAACKNQLLGTLWHALVQRYRGGECTGHCTACKGWELLHTATRTTITPQGQTASTKNPLSFCCSVSNLTVPAITPGPRTTANQ
eukprot:scaffold47993_cov17-Tisochrysis_lutea.AAC.1